MTLERGTLLHKRYRIVEILGQGGMGSVYRAVDENLGVDVAVKENLFTTDEYARQFRLEAVILANLRHPNLPRVSDHFVMGEQGQYLVMDFIEGEDLRQRMERMGFITDDDAVMIGAAMCDALSYLHTRKPAILHRDIKPGNVKITPDGHIFLVDFGLAKLLQGGQATTTGARAMTPGYSPPEQYGTARTDARTDVYSLGATLYAALCGMIPEDGLARAMDNAQLTPLRKRNPKVSRRLAAVIEKAMAVDPADRFQTAEEFKKALLAAKARTERATGEFTVVPPPIVQGSLSPMDKELPIDPKPKAPVGPLPSPIDEDKPFVPPKKRRRGSSAWLWLLLWLLILGAAGVVAFFPGALPANLRVSLPLLFISSPIPSPTVTATPDALPTDTARAATGVPPTVGLPLATSTSFSIAIGTLIPLGTPSDTPAAAMTPAGGGGGQIAFVSERSGIPQIYLSDLSGSNVVPITNMSGGACQPSWSPDGLRLVFVSPCPRRLDISEPPPPDTALYITNVDGTNLTPLPTEPGGDLEPAWSPDGKRIAFTSLRDGHMQIYTLNLDDQSVTRLTNTSQDVDTRQPAWSPFGNQIAYAVKRVEVYQIWTMTDTGQGQQQIVRNGQDYWDYLPIWSPDGKVVLFAERYANAPVLPWEESIVYENRDTTTSERVKLGPLPNENARYSPDGLWIVFETKDADENRDIYYMSPSGGERIRLTKDPSSDFDPVWRPGPSQ